MLKKDDLEVEFDQDSERIVSHWAMAINFSVIEKKTRKVIAGWVDFSSEDGLWYDFRFRNIFSDKPNTIDARIPKQEFGYDSISKSWEKKNPKEEFSEDILYDTYIIPKMIELAIKYYWNRTT